MLTTYLLPLVQFVKKNQDCPRLPPLHAICKKARLCWCFTDTVTMSCNESQAIGGKNHAVANENKKRKGTGGINNPPIQ